MPGPEQLFEKARYALTAKHIADAYAGIILRWKPFFVESADESLGYYPDGWNLVLDPRMDAAQMATAILTVSDAYYNDYQRRLRRLEPGVSPLASSIACEAETVARWSRTVAYDHIQASMPGIGWREDEDPRFAWGLDMCTPLEAYYYEVLPKLPDPESVATPAGGVSGSDEQSAPEPRPGGRGDGRGQNGPDDGQAQDGPGDGQGQDGPGDGQGQGKTNGPRLRMDLANFSSGLDERKQIEAEVADQVQRHGIGSLGLEKMVRVADIPDTTLPPQAILAHIARNRPGFSRRIDAPPKRRFDPDGPIPTRLRRGYNRIAWAVDTSGTMVHEPEYLAEIKAMFASVAREVRDVSWATGDTKLAAHGRGRNADDIEFRGGGGTDMRQLALDTYMALKPDVIVLCTDGLTPWPDVWPCDVITIICNDRVVPVPDHLGPVVQMAEWAAPRRARVGPGLRR